MAFTVHHNSCAAIFFVATFLLSSLVFADTVRIPVGQQATVAPAIDMPQKGISKARVKELFGEPSGESAAKGNPPISNWKYTEFVVYFEGDHVIHSVRVFHPATPGSQPAE